MKSEEDDVNRLYLCIYKWSFFIVFRIKDEVKNMIGKRMGTVNGWVVSVVGRE